jgi:hypothetical protein
VKFQIGDRVREGTHVGTVTDVGTVLIQVKSDEGGLRVACPWELVKIGTLGCGLGKPVRRSWIGTALGSNLGPERNTSGW